MTEKTVKCIVNKCGNIATNWTGNVLKSRSKVIAGFCDDHKNIKCPNSFGVTGCYGLYSKSLRLMNVNEHRDEGIKKNIIEQ